MKKVELLFNVRIMDSELVVCGPIENAVEVHINQPCSSIDKRTLSDGSFNLILSAVCVGSNIYTETISSVINYCLEVGLANSFILTLMRNIVEELYVQEKLSLEEYSTLWAEIIEASDEAKMCILPFKFRHMLREGIISTFESCVYAPVSKLHTPICKDNKIVGYKEFNDEDGIVEYYIDELTK